MAASNKRLMKASEIPAFVDAIIKAGCDICAIGHHGYVLGDVDLTPTEREVVMPIKEDRRDLRRSRFPQAGNRCPSTIDRPVSGTRLAGDALVGEYENSSLKAPAAPFSAIL